ncbi:MAG TPA: c-type cytochrome domain-containing protein [Edaphobacter sp.]
MRRVLVVGAIGALAGVLAGTLGSTAVRASGDDEAAKPEFYTQKVRPIFEANCYRCHGGMNHRGGLTIDTRAGMLKGGHDGAVLVPGDPEKSLLVKLIRHEGPANDPMPMPPRGKLSDADIATVERWVRAGATMPEDAPPPQ